MTIPNRGYDPETIIASRKSFDVIHIKVNGQEVGKYCKCGCGKRLEQLKYSQRYKKKIRARKNMEFYNATCRRKYHDKIHGKPKPKNHIDSIIHLEIKKDSLDIPFRILTLYFANNQKMDIKLTKESGELWKVLDKVQKYRTLPNYSDPMIVIPKNTLQMINERIT